MTRAVQAARLLFGAWMTVSGLNYLVGPVVPLPEGATPLAVQLLAAFDHSGLLGVAMAIELAAGALLIAGIWVPFALATLMPINTCALYWALVLNQQPGWALLALAGFALNGLLMLAHLESYRDILRGNAVAAGEAPGPGYGKLFVNPMSDAPHGAYPGALAALVAALAFYYWIVPGSGGSFALIVLSFPAAVLLAGWARSFTKRA